ncbi:MAG TPA: hypothetical protein VFK24_05585 [Gammaproteobacteria bacterium]|nr:hypothetical protein [Gammaproteobacteria bacterium]
MPHPDWNESYATDEAPPWDTGEPNEYLVEFVRSRAIKPGRALDVGCGTGTPASVPGAALNGVSRMRIGAAVVWLTLVPAVVAAAPSQQVWTIPASHPCTGLSAIWMPPLAMLKPLVGEWTPAPGPKKGHGIFVLFVTRCPQSSIGGHPVGPSIVGAMLVAVKPPPALAKTTASRKAHWAALVNVFGDPNSAVARLFAQDGFPVTPARLALQVDDDRGIATFSIATDAGETHLQARVAEPATAMAHQTVMVSVGETPIGIIRGFESATRQSKGAGMVKTEGDTWPARLALPLIPAGVALDSDFRWAFEFVTCSASVPQC